MLRRQDGTNAQRFCSSHCPSQSSPPRPIQAFYLQISRLNVSLLEERFCRRCGTLLDMLRDLPGCQVYSDSFRRLLFSSDAALNAECVLSPVIFFNFTSMVCLSRCLMLMINRYTLVRNLLECLHRPPIQRCGGCFKFVMTIQSE